MSCRAAAETGGPVVLGCEKSGVHILFVRRELAAYPEVVNRNLMLKVDNRVVKLNALSQLRGHVRIDSPQQALDFVRFRTSLYTFFYWRGRRFFEVIPDDAVAKMPTYGFDRYYETHPGGAGDAGVISPGAYRLEKFTAPTVTRSGDHFEVVRWLYFPGLPQPGTVRLVRETIGADGSYDCVTLKSLPAPKLPDTYWRRPLFA